MKKKRIQYNELNEEIYDPRYWTRAKLIAIGSLLLVFGFIFNLNLEEKINHWLLTTLSTNESCPIVFEKAELSYFLPKVTVKKPVILGSCFGQVNNRLPLQTFQIAFSGPSFYPLGIKLHVSLTEGRTKLNFYPTLSPFSQYVDIENSNIDSAIFRAMTADNKSPIAGNLEMEGFLKFANGKMEDGQLKISSKNFYLPSQNIKGFELDQVNLKTLLVRAHFTNKTTMQIDQIQIGATAMPIDLRLKGNLLMSSAGFINSQLQLNGTLHLSEYFLTKYPYVKSLFLPENNTSGTYQMRINGPLGNLGPPQIN